MDGVKKVTLKSSVPVAGDISVDFSGSILSSPPQRPKSLSAETFSEGRRTVSPSPPDTGDWSVSLSDGETVISHYTAENLSRAGATLSVGCDDRGCPDLHCSNVWVYGGTGPEYGGGKLYDLLEKEEYFNNEDGRGVSAIKDNYFELRHNGEFVNWGRRGRKELVDGRSGN